MFQIHLVGRGWSGRAVRVEPLTAAEIETAELTAATEITKDSLQLEYQNKVERLGMEVMIKEISEPAAKGATPEGWKKVTPQDLALGMSKYFTAKDMSTLKALYRSEHSVSQAEVDAILESKINVLAD